MKRHVFGFVAAAITTISASASAQVWLRDRANTQGPGIRSGDLEFHPGIGVEVGYDSNYFQRSTRYTAADNLPVIDTVRLRVTPSFHVSTLTTQRKDGGPAIPPKVSFDAGAALVYSEFLTNADKLGRNREFGVLGDLVIGIAPGRPWGFNILDNFVRTTQPSLVADTTVGLDRDDNRAAGELVYTKPGGLLDWRVGYAFGITYFEKTPIQPLNNVRHEIYTRGRWKFLPRTAFVYDGSVHFIHYTNSSALNDSTPLRTRVGLSGLFTDRFAVLAMVGWGSSFYKSQAGQPSKDFDSVIGQLEFRYFLSGAAPEAGTQAPAMSSIAAGFTRDFFNSYLGNFYERDRFYVGVNALFAQRFFLGIDAGAAIIRYVGIPGKEAFNDTRLDATLFGEYRVRDWLGFNATFQYLGERSTNRIPTGTPASGFDLQFDRFQALAGVRAMF
jgi:hypothetical protein